MSRFPQLQFESPLRNFIVKPSDLSSDEPGVAEILDQDLVDEVVLSEGLNHHHPLSAQLQQDFWDVQCLKETDRCGDGHSCIIVHLFNFTLLKVSDRPRCAPDRL